MASITRRAQRGSQGVDPITAEVLRNTFKAIADEMNANLARSAYTPIIYEMKDCSVGLFNERAELLGQSPGLPIFLGALDEAIKAVIAKVGLENFQPGDVYMSNDPYVTGSHLNDITSVSPVFFKGEVVGFTATKAHWMDVGAKDAGVSIDTTEIYQEGVRFGPSRVVAAGEPVVDLIDILLRNSRLPKPLLGDMNAQIAACRTGERRYAEVIERFGLDTVRGATQVIFDQAERADRDVIAGFPDGVYVADGYIDSDGIGDEPVYVRATVTISGTDVTVDLTGSSSQCPGCANVGLAQTISAARLGYKFLINPYHAPNGGHFRALTVIVPPGTMYSAQEPAAVVYYGTPLGMFLEVMLKAFSLAIPDRVAAGQRSDPMNVVLAGYQPDGRLSYVTAEATAVGFGAFEGSDGANAVVNYMGGDLKNLPIEVLESKYPLQIHRYALEADSGGPGEYRGGLGVIKDYVPTDDSSRLTLWFERNHTPPWGLEGGGAGRPAGVFLGPSTPEEQILMKINHLPLPGALVISARTGGGGGYGPPWRRPVEAVLDDVRDGYVSRAGAREDYGLCLEEGRMEADLEATRAARAALAKEDKDTP
jgi:N-methylhydantoinase B